jgi:signal transduction histidine kinase
LLVLGEQSMAEVLERLEKEQAARFLAIGFRLRDMEEKEPLTLERMESVAEESDLLNVFIFDGEGNRELALRGGPGSRRPPWAGQGGGRGPGGGGGRGGGGGFGGQGPLSVDAIQAFLQSDLSYKIEGMHTRRWFHVFRYSVMVRRRVPGVIVIHMDADSQEALRDQLGPRTLLAEFVKRPDVHYVKRLVNNETVVDLQKEEGPIPLGQVLEVSVPLPGVEGDLLTVGFDRNMIDENEQLLFQRLLLSAGVAALLGVMVLLWARLQKRHTRVSQLLTQIHSYHRTVLDTMENAVIAWDPQERLVFWNPKAERLFPELQSPHSPETIPTSMQTLLARISSEPVVELEEQEMGSRRYRVEETQIHEPFPTRLLFLFDVTSVEEATREHDRREHVEALAKVASGVAHEVRNPLNAIDMTIQTLCMDPSTLTESDRETLESLRAEINRINKMVEHFLAFGRPQPPVFAEADLGAIQAEILTLLDGPLEKQHIQVQIETEANGTIEADAQQIKQALLNIILNAIEASPPGAILSFQIKREADGVLWVCEDQGRGMSVDQLATLFDPYVTHKPGGTGLGMSIVKRILDSHQATIHVSSAEGKGTRVEIRFSQGLYPEQETEEYPCTTA